MVPSLLLIIFFCITSNAIETSLIEWCDAGCNVIVLDNGFTYHCIYAYEYTKQLILSYPSNTQTSQCLYHALSYDNTSMHNITLIQHDVDNACPSDCIDWYNGCTECLCINNASLCNLNIINTESCSSSYIKHHCQMSKSQLDRHGYDISLLTWFSIVNISTDYEILLPLSISNQLKSILIKYISEYTMYYQYTKNISCNMLYPYNYTNYYSFSNTNNTFNIDNLFNNILPQMNETHSTFNSTDTVNSSILFSTEFSNFNNSFSNIPSIYPSIQPTKMPIPMDSISEYDGNYYNYIPQCTISFDNKQTAIEFMTDFRNHSNILRQNLHSILTYYYTNNISILLTTDDINETLYQYTQENEYLYIQYTNNTQTLHIDESIIDDWNNSTQISSNYELLLNKSLYSIQLNSFSYYFGNMSSPLTTTLPPTKSPTKPRDCWFDGKLIQHNKTYYQNKCYYVECNNGKVNINDKYCDAHCYHEFNTTTDECCITPDGKHCGEDNDDCPKQNDCVSCVGNDRICSWIGDHCSAVCVGAYCWENGKCPKIIIIRLHIRGITMQQLNSYEGLLNHAIAESLDITENLIKNYFPTQTPNIDVIEVKKAISLTVKDEKRIPNILSAEPNDEYVEILNSEIKKTFSNIAVIRSTIKVIDVEYGGFEGENNNKNKSTENDIEWTNDAFIILLICGGLVLITICALCYRYPILSYCCCCIPIAIRRKMKNCTRDNCCECCQRFSFGVLYDDGVSDLVKRRREERMRNLIIRNEIMDDINSDRMDAKELEEEEYHQLNVENVEVKNVVKKKKKGKKNKGKDKHKKKKKKCKRKKDKKKSLSEFEFDKDGISIHSDIVEQNEMDINDCDEQTHTQEIAMSNIRNSNREMLYHNRQRDLIEEDETNNIL